MHVAVVRHNAKTEALLQARRVRGRCVYRPDTERKVVWADSQMRAQLCPIIAGSCLPEQLGGMLNSFGRFKAIQFLRARATQGPGRFL